MRLKRRYVNTEPVIGTTRLKRVFAFIPLSIGGDYIWLEFYELLQGYCTTKYKVVIDGELKELSVNEWKTLSKRKIN